MKQKIQKMHTHTHTKKKHATFLKYGIGIRRHQRISKVENKNARISNISYVSSFCTS